MFCRKCGTRVCEDETPKSNEGAADREDKVDNNLSGAAGNADEKIEKVSCLSDDVLVKKFNPTPIILVVVLVVAVAGIIYAIMSRNCTGKSGLSPNSSAIVISQTSTPVTSQGNSVQSSDSSENSIDMNLGTESAKYVSNRNVYSVLCLNPDGTFELTIDRDFEVSGISGNYYGTADGYECMSLDGNGEGKPAGFELIRDGERLICHASPELWEIDSAVYYKSDDDTSLESNLIGRWRSYDGGYIELRADGTADTSLKIGKDYFESAIIRMASSQWSASNGQFTISVLYRATYWYEYQMYDTYDNLTLITNDGGNLTFLRPDYGFGNGVLGLWQDGVRIFEFNSDGTGMFVIDLGLGGLGNVNMPINWEYAENGSIDSILLEYGFETHLDYYLSGDRLTIFTDDGSTVYTRVSQ